MARKAGVSHQAPYHYFDDREAILAALAGEGFSKLGQSLVRTAAQAGAKPVEAVEAMLGKFIACVSSRLSSERIGKGKCRRSELFAPGKDIACDLNPSSTTRRAAANDAKGSEKDK